MKGNLKGENQVLFQKRLKELRIERGLNQKELAEKATITRETLCRLENGKQVPDKGTIPLLAKPLRVTEAYLKGESDDKSSAKVWDELYKKELPEMRKSTMSLDYFGEQSPDENKQSEAFVALLLSMGYSMNEIQNYSEELQELQKKAVDMIQFAVDQMGLLRKLPPKRTKRKKVNK